MIFSSDDSDVSMIFDYYKVNYSKEMRNCIFWGEGCNLYYENVHKNSVLKFHKGLNYNGKNNFISSFDKSFIIKSRLKSCTTNGSNIE